MAITSVDTFLAAAKSRQLYLKPSATSTPHVFVSMWTVAGFPAAGVAPGTAAGEAPTSTTTGAIPIPTPGGTNRLYLGSVMSAPAGSGGIFTFYDRLVHTGALVGNSTTAQAVNSAALPRYTDGVGVEIWAEVYTTTGTGTPTLTVSYTNQAGVAGRTAVCTTWVANNATRMFPIPLQAGDTGVLSVQSATLSAATSAAGVWGITLCRPLASLSYTTSGAQPNSLDFAQLGLPEIQAGACVAVRVLTSGSSTGPIQADLLLAEG